MGKSRPPPRARRSISPRSQRPRTADAPRVISRSCPSSAATGHLGSCAERSTKLGSSERTSARRPESSGRSRSMRHSLLAPGGGRRRGGARWRRKACGCAGWRWTAVVVAAGGGGRWGGGRSPTAPKRRRVEDDPVVPLTSPRGAPDVREGVIDDPPHRLARKARQLGVGARARDGGAGAVEVGDVRVPRGEARQRGSARVAKQIEHLQAGWGVRWHRVARIARAAPRGTDSPGCERACRLRTRMRRGEASQAERSQRQFVPCSGKAPTCPF
mmetsp:Transcript_33082/g.97501  ORF Transcript_33082/g.97501 Transcript_33082/m.97501 type:complete len:272 (+) Transcript_33082:88-903(+)